VVFARRTAGPWAICRTATHHPARFGGLGLHHTGLGEGVYPRRVEEVSKNGRGVIEGPSWVSPDELRPAKRWTGRGFGPKHRCFTLDRRPYRHVRQHVGRSHKAPGRIVAVETDLRCANGKLDYPVAEEDNRATPQLAPGGWEWVNSGSEEFESRFSSEVHEWLGRQLPIWIRPRRGEGGALWRRSGVYIYCRSHPGPRIGYGAGSQVPWSSTRIHRPRSFNTGGATGANQDVHNLGEKHTGVGRG